MGCKASFFETLKSDRIDMERLPADQHTPHDKKVVGFTTQQWKVLLQSTARTAEALALEFAHA